MLNTTIAAKTRNIPAIATGPMVSPITKNPKTVAAARRLADQRLSLRGALSQTGFISPG